MNLPRLHLPQKLQSLLSQVRRVRSLSFWRSKLLPRLKAMIDVRPRDAQDYFPVCHWLISRRLAFFLVTAVLLACLWVIFSVLPRYSAQPGQAFFRTFRYDAVALKFYNGPARILAGDGRLAYEGQVKDARCAGQGTLYGRDGVRVYEGEFENSRYNGTGSLYYPNGAPHYQGEFVDNVYQGQGREYRENGSLAYEGAFSEGMRSGAGRLFNAKGSPIFQGDFQQGQVFFPQFLGCSTQQAASLYTGHLTIYQGEAEYAVAMDELNAVYTAADGANALEGDWRITGVYVLSDSFPAPDRAISSLEQVTAMLGQPQYSGTAWVSLPEAVSLNQLAQAGRCDPVSMTANPVFDSVYSVTEYDRNHTVYLYTYEGEGLLYTFYTAEPGLDSFLMYAIHSA